MMVLSFGVPKAYFKKNNVLFFASLSFTLLSKPLEFNFVINKINLITLSNTTLFMKKFKTLASIPKKIVIYHTKNLCHHIKHNLFYL